jgi:hypothetical protein
MKARKTPQYCNLTQESFLKFYFLHFYFAEDIAGNKMYKVAKWNKMFQETF